MPARRSSPRLGDQLARLAVERDDRSARGGVYDTPLIMNRHACTRLLTTLCLTGTGAGATVRPVAAAIVRIRRSYRQASLS
jgi:hypothetical protein